MCFKGLGGGGYVEMVGGYGMRPKKLMDDLNKWRWWVYVEMVGGCGMRPK